MIRTVRRWCTRSAAVLLTSVATVVSAAAQQLTFTPDQADGIYAVGERVGWTVTLPRAAASGARPAGPYTYTIRRNGGELIASGRLELRRGRARIETVATEPAMLLVEIQPPTPDSTFGSRSQGGPGRIRLGAAVDPTRIQPAEPEPADFDEFWAAKIRQLEAIPMDPVITPGESGRPGVEYATIRLRNIRGAHVYGQLARPSGPGKFPALVIYQWAGGPYPLQKSWVTERAAEGWLVLNIMPHDVPGDLPQAFYNALPAVIRNYTTLGQHSREESHFLQMYLGDYRAVEYLATRPEWNGQTLVAMGTSMGGQQGFAAAGLNRRVTAMIVHVPAGADVTGALHGRMPSYPNWNVTRPEVLTTARYFDAANFAARITVPSLVSMGFIDDITTPASIWAAYNRIRGPKEVAPMPTASHNNYATAEQQIPFTRRAQAWLESLAGGGDPTATRAPEPSPRR